MNITVPSIACEVCANTIAKAIKNCDPDAIVNVDVTTKVVEIDTQKTLDEMKKVIIEVGHSIN
ncbi:heavy metal transporter [Geminocystis sp. NIES-3709]|uniref:heavy metal transporter n=1 Tax=Geminocystis sp. NIES-3709 TaxID=1617448 RepID=UPI0005FC5D1C|nr:heavy metal transporter [Geminocystis sp. NIES-3709]BAQ66085.1 heavy metal transport/detoxification protein [Geminocystis sp. NIES-3709]